VTEPTKPSPRGATIAARLTELASIDAGRSVVSDLLGVARRRKGTILVVVLAALLGAYATLTYTTEQFEADARLIVMLGRENVEAPVTVASGSIFTSGVQEEEVNSYVQLLESRSLAEEAVDTIGPDKFKFEPPAPKTWFQKAKSVVRGAARYAKSVLSESLIALDLKKRISERDKVVKLVQRSLKVTREGRSNVIHLSLRLPSADLASETLDVLIAAYFKRHVQLREVPNIIDLFGSEAVQYRSELESLQAERSKVREEWGVSSVEVQRAEMLRRLSLLQASYDEQRATLELRRGQLVSLNATIAAMPERVMSSEVQEPNPTAETILSSLDGARVQRINALSKYTADSAVVRAYDEQIAALELLLTTAQERRLGPATSSPNPERMELQGQAAGYKAEIVGFEASIAEKATQVAALQSELNRLNKGEEILHLMDLERSVLEQKFIANANRREEARIEAGLNSERVANVAILSPPVTNPEPASPKKMTIMGVSIVAGLFLGLGLALLMEWSDDTIYDPEGVSRPGDAPFLGEFSLG